MVGHHATSFLFSRGESTVNYDCHLMKRLLTSALGTFAEICGSPVQSSTLEPNLTHAIRINCAR